MSTTETLAAQLRRNWPYVLFVAMFLALLVQSWRIDQLENENAEAVSMAKQTIELVMNLNKELETCQRK